MGFCDSSLHLEGSSRDWRCCLALSPPCTVKPFGPLPPPATRIPGPTRQSVGSPGFCVHHEGIQIFCSECTRGRIELPLLQS